MAATDNPNVDPNYSNSTAQAPDTKPTRSDSFGEIIDPAKQQERQNVAAAAEREWIKQTAAADYSEISRGNKIRLVSTTTAPGEDSDKINTGVEAITFELSPEISESKQVMYAEIGDIRTAGSILIYGGSPSRRWQVTAKFLSRSREEAGNTWKSIQLLRAWTNPDVNYRYGVDAPGIPRVLRLHGYGRTWQGIPVVINSLNVEYPTDIDYIPAAQIVDGESIEYGSLVPVVQTVTFQLTEARRLDDLLNKFDLESFKRGTLTGW